MDIAVRIAGEAGQGVETAGGLLVDSLAGSGLHVFSTQSYMSRIRGGLNWFDIRIADKELFGPRERPDLLVALTAEALDTLATSVEQGGAILFDGKDDPRAICVPFSDVAREIAGSRVMANTVAAGAAYAVMGYDVKHICARLEDAFRKKGAEVVEQNVRCARRGAELVAAHAGRVPGPAAAGAPGAIYNGSEAIRLGSATAGVKFASAYPMTPATGVFTFLAGAADDYGIVVEQAEDEIAAINMVCGAVYAGVPALTTTSGGGFALMTEGLSLAGMMELPALIVLAQRPGPSTGLPTRTGQQDLKFALYAGHGEFPRAIFAPGTARQAYEVTRRALQIAHKYQSPAIVMTDQFLADQRKNQPELDATLRPIDPHLVTDPNEDYLRYAETQDGVSPRAAPGGGAFVVCDSDEHTEGGHITEDLEVRVRMQDKRMRKEAGMMAEALPPEVYGPREAEHVLVAWGSTYGPCREAVDRLAAGGVPAVLVHFPQVWPLDTAAAREALFPEGRARRVTSVEGNATGQFASILRERGVLENCELMLRYDGMPFTGEEIARRAAQ